MIRLEKTDEPKVLQDNAAAWTNELLGKLATDEGPSKYLLSRYRHKDIKDALLSETHAKCAYCESKFRHIAYGDVEHITSRNEQPALSFNWQNLTIACDICNTNKGAIAAGILVDPYVDEPSVFFRFGGAMVMPIAGLDKADVTNRRLDLNRSALLESRAARLQNIGSQLSNILKTPNEDYRRILLQEFVETELADASEYCAFVREYYRSEAAENASLRLPE
jgi:uncharacterized protein (TIGR02646 family)